MIDVRARLPLARVVQRAAMFAAAAAMIAALGASPAAAAHKHKHHRRLTALGRITGTGEPAADAVGPGAQPASTAVYVTYTYASGSFDLAQIDPDTGAVRQYRDPLPGEQAAYALAAGADGNVYIGTSSSGRLARLDPRTGAVSDLGRPERGETYVFSLTSAPGGDIYGCTYPDAKLFRYDPASGRTTDLGRMDPTEQYARFCVAGDDGYVYVGIGTERDDVVAYDIATGEVRHLLPAGDRAPGMPRVFRGADGHVYASAVMTNGGPQTLRLSNGQAAVVGSAPPQSEGQLADGRIVLDQFAGDAIALCAPGPSRCAALPNVYADRKPIHIFQLALGPDRRVYVSTTMPIYLARTRRGAGLESLGGLPGGEIYVMLAHGRRLLFGSYSGRTYEVGTYNPRRPFSPGPGAGDNPRLINVPGVSATWRPQTIVPGRGGWVYIGSVPGYGEVTGSITAWNPRTGAIHTDQPVPGQSVTSLAAVPGTRSLLVGGTSTAHGSGVADGPPPARLFVWDPASRRKLYEAPVPGSLTISDVVATARDRVYALARNGGFTQLVRLDLATHAVTARAWPCGPLPASNSAVIRRGRILVVGTTELCTIDPRTGAVRRVAGGLPPIDGGYALGASRLYFGAGTSVYAYELPPALRARGSR